MTNQKSKIKNQKSPVVLIVMGSDSDLPVMTQAEKIFQEFGVQYEMRILSAHRTPEAVHDLAVKAKQRGVKVLVAGAGGAAHLPGVMAAYTTLPVIGVPINSSPLDGVDALYSIVQMPPGIPVATVGINAAKNAALLAVEILAVSDIHLSRKLQQFRQKQAEMVLARDREVQQGR